MSNNEKFCAMLNACNHPRQVYNALMALAPIIREAKEDTQREAVLASLQAHQQGEGMKP